MVAGIDMCHLPLRLARQHRFRLRRADETAESVLLAR